MAVASRLAGAEGAGFADTVAGTTTDEVGAATGCEVEGVAVAGAGALEVEAAGFTSSNQTAHLAPAQDRPLKRPKPIVIISGYVAFVVWVVHWWNLIGSTKVL
jgi:hypothetical protein